MIIEHFAIVLYKYAYSLLARVLINSIRSNSKSNSIVEVGYPTKSDFIK